MFRNVQGIAESNSRGLIYYTMTYSFGDPDYSCSLVGGYLPKRSSCYQGPVGVEVPLQLG